MIRFTSIFAGVGLSLAVGGCASLPSAGPTSQEIVSQESSGDAINSYMLIDVDGRTVDILSKRPRASLYGMFKNEFKRPDVKIGVGDALTITIWEAAAGGLFSTASLDRNTPGSRTATLPEQEVAQDGTVQVPYAGRIKVANLRPAEVESLIVKNLKGKAIEPQAVVSISRNRSTTVTLSGEATAGMIAPVSVKGERIIDVIAAGGGIKAPAHESMVYLTRGQNTAKVPFSTILADARENIYVRPGDTLTVLREPAKYTAFGGTGRNELVPFDAPNLTVEQALARSGGLLDYRADSTGVFLLRFESANLVGQMLPDRRGQITTAMVPVIYRFNLREPKSYFFAQAFEMRDKDILYVANAPLAETLKVLNIVGAVTGPVASGAAVYTLAK